MMKSLYIFAFVVLFACGFGLDDESSGGVFTPAAFDCNFQMQYSLTDSGSTSKGTYSGYGGSRSFTRSYKYSGEDRWRKQTLRADISGGNPGQALFSEAVDYDGDKDCRNSYYTYNTTKIGLIHQYVEESFEYDKKEDGTWNGVSCTVYSADDDDEKLYVKDDRVIGYQKGEGTISAVVLSVNYTGKAYEEDFTISDTYTGCKAGAYTTIEHIDTCELDSRYKTFTPKAFGCSFWIYFTLNSQTSGNYTGTYSGYGDSRSFLYFGTMSSGVSVYYWTTLRADINGGYEGEALSSKAYRLATSYNCDSDGYVENDTKIGSIYQYVETPLTYDAKKNGEWNGHNCTVYFHEDEFVFYVEDDRVIGYVDSKNVYTFTYGITAFAEDFTIKKKYSGCRDGAYTPITEIKGCPLDSRTFTPTPLPCGYAVEFTLEQDEPPRKVHGYEAGYGNYLSLHAEYKIRNENTRSMKLQRIDIGRKGRNMSAAVFELYSNSTSDVCNCVGFNEPYDENYDQISPIHSIITDNIEFLFNKTGVKFNGVICDELFDDEGDTYYVKDGHVIGMYDADTYGFRVEYFFSYKNYDKVYEGDFMIPEEFTDCADYEEAYEAPGKIAGCKIKSGNRSGASTIKAFAIFVVATIISSLLF